MINTIVALVMASIFGSLAFGHEARKPECNEYWKAIRTANDQYEEKGDKKAGIELLKKLPKGKELPPRDCAVYKETIEALNRDAKYRTERVKAGEPTAIQISFRLMNIADGAFAEELDIDLGNIITKYPNHFLKYLKAEHGEKYCPEGLMGNTGNYDQDTASENKAMDQRIQALMKVKDKSLTKVRDLCVSVLRKLKKT